MFDKLIYQINLKKIYPGAPENPVKVSERVFQERHTRWSERRSSLSRSNSRISLASNVEKQEWAN